MMSKIESQLLMLSELLMNGLLALCVNLETVLQAFFEHFIHTEWTRVDLRVSNMQHEEY